MKYFLLKSSRIASALIVLFLFFSIKIYAQHIPEENTQVMTEETDWPNLNRYRNANENLTSPAENASRIVFMGNSITEGWLQIYPEFFEDKPYINRGIGGQTTPQMLIRFRPDVIDLEPAAVVILAGVNDIAGNTGPSTLKMIEDNLISMAELARVNGIQVILASILPAYDFPWRPGLEPAGKIVTLNERIKTYAENNNMVYLDFFSSMADERNGMKPGYSEDEVHPNREAYKVMSVLAEEAIEKALSGQ